MIKLFLFTFLTLSFFASAPTFGAEEGESPSKKNDISDILDNLGYPELQVVPRASERLALEAKGEDSSPLFTHWPIQISGLATLFVGATAKGNLKLNLTDAQKTDAGTMATASTAIGAVWVIGAGVLGWQRPYRSALNTISKYSGKDERSALLRERLAEEALERPARVMRLLETVAVITNLGANAMVAIHANDAGKISAGVGAVLAFLPLMFEDHNISVYQKHLEYKRKIYTPLKSASLNFDSYSKTFTPMTNLTWVF